MAAAMELRCWGGDWGLPSVHTDSLVVLLLKAAVCRGLSFMCHSSFNCMLSFKAYANFSGAKLSVCPVDWTWKTLTASVPELVVGDSVVHEATQILNFLRKQRFNADYELTARQGADTMAYIALLEEKLRPALLHTFWVDAENYSNLTRPWFASRSPFPLNFFIPGRLANIALSRILVTKGEGLLHRVSEVEGKIYSDAKETLNLLSYRLGTANYFFENFPTSLDAFVFGFLAPLHKAALPSCPLQSHLRQLDNLTRFCDNILAAHFSADNHCLLPPVQETMDANLQKLTQLVNKESNLIKKMDDNLQSSPQHKPHRPDPKPSFSPPNNSTPA